MARNNDPTPAPLAPAEHGECHGLFTEPSEEGPAKDRWEPVPPSYIRTIEVRRYSNPTGAHGQKYLLRTYAPDQLRDLEQLRDLHGGGHYEITARASAEAGQQPGSCVRVVAAFISGNPKAELTVTPPAPAPSSGFSVAPLDVGSVVGGAGGLAAVLTTAWAESRKDAREEREARDKKEREEREARREREEKRETREREERMEREERREKADREERERRDKLERDDALRREKADAELRALQARVFDAAARPALVAAPASGGLSATLEDFAKTKAAVDKMTGAGDLLKFLATPAATLGVGRLLGIPPEALAMMAGMGNKAPGSA